MADPYTNIQNLMQAGLDAMDDLYEQKLFSIPTHTAQGVDPSRIYWVNSNKFTLKQYDGGFVWNSSKPKPEPVETIDDVVFDAE